MHVNFVSNGKGGHVDKGKQGDDTENPEPGSCEGCSLAHELIDRISAALRRRASANVRECVEFGLVAHASALEVFFKSIQSSHAHLGVVSDICFHERGVHDSFEAWALRESAHANV